ncbi:hypothetical protein Tco_0099338 [Tanacetum coccineum]
MCSMVVKNIEVDRMAHERWLRKGEKHGFDSKEDGVVPKVEDVSLVDGVFDGALGGDRDEDFAIGEGGDWMMKLEWKPWKKKKKRNVMKRMRRKDGWGPPGIYEGCFLGTDKAKSIRKQLKPGKHEHKNGRARKKPEGMLWGRKDNSRGQVHSGRVKHHHEPHWSIPSKEGTRRHEGKARDGDFDTRKSKGQDWMEDLAILELEASLEAI